MLTKRCKIRVNPRRIAAEANVVNSLWRTTGNHNASRQRAAHVMRHVPCMRHFGKNTTTANNERPGHRRLMKDRRPALVSLELSSPLPPFQRNRSSEDLSSPAKMAEPPETFSPSRIGEYTVVAEIAEGTFGKVKSLSTFLLGSASATTSNTSE